MFTKLLTYSILLASAVAVQAQDDAVVRAMKDEMQRSLKKLQLEKMEKPYFLSYRIEDSESKTAAATFGSLINSSEGHTRFLSVQVRVGDYNFDNSNYFSFPMMGTGVATNMFAGSVQMPLDDNYDELRRQLWLATDGAYKKALENLAGKRAALENTQRNANIPDFSKEPSVTTSDEAPPVAFDLPAIEKLARDLSAVFRQAPGVDTSHTSVTARNQFERYLNSEGTFFQRRTPSVHVNVTASTQAVNGMPLRDRVEAFGRTMGDLPSKETLVSSVRAMATQLGDLRKVPLIENFNGPVLFEGQAAGELVARFLATQILASPHVVSDSRQIAQAMRSQQAPDLSNKIGSRVLPDFMTVVDDPTTCKVGQDLLAGCYKVDEEGVTARTTTAVKDGILKTLLSSRAPIRGVLQSTGNLRQHGVAPSNLIFSAEKSLALEELKARLLEIVKARGLDFGVIVR